MIFGWLRRRRERKSLIEKCPYDHAAGSPAMVIRWRNDTPEGVLKPDHLSCMFCPYDAALPEHFTIRRNGALGGGWDTVTPVDLDGPDPSNVLPWPKKN